MCTLFTLVLALGSRLRLMEQRFHSLRFGWLSSTFMVSIECCPLVPLDTAVLSYVHSLTKSHLDDSLLSAATGLTCFLAHYT